MPGPYSLSRIPLSWVLAACAIALAPAVRAQVLDTTPPTIVAEATTAPNATGWYRTSVRVKFTCADTQSKVVACGPAVTVTGEGAGQVITGTARDKAGNTASASITINIDKTAPAMTAARAPEAPAAGWDTTPVTVTFDADRRAVGPGARHAVGAGDVPDRSNQRDGHGARHRPGGQRRHGPPERHQHRSDARRASG